MVGINRILSNYFKKFHIWQHKATSIISENNHQSFVVIKLSKGGNKMIEGGFGYGQQRRVGEAGNVSAEEFEKPEFTSRDPR